MSREQHSGETLLDSLNSSWNDLTQGLQDRESVSFTFDQIVSAYKDRPYHNLNHIDFMLGVIDQVSDGAKNLQALKYAIWFHDYVYNGAHGEDEANSALAAEKALKAMGENDATIEEVGRLIRLTAEHVTNTQDTDGLLLIDADLAILGADPEKYDWYSGAIRQEYAHFPDDSFRTGRTAVLENFLKRENIFNHPSIKERYQDQARINIQNEIDTLKGKVG